MTYQIEYYCMSHVGKCRKVNQDNFICAKNIMNYKNAGTEDVLHGYITPAPDTVFGIFDGMGGEEQGEMAAYIAAKNMLEYTQWTTDQQALFDYCKLANAEICRYTDEHSLTSMGTTAAILRFAEKNIWLCNIGDSKIFRLVYDGMQQISMDHVAVSAFGTKPPLSQNLGIPEDELLIEPYIASGTYQEGDVYLICSDGLTDMVSLDSIEKILRTSDREAVSEKLMRSALDNGGKDNVTFIILYIERKQKDSLLNRLSKRLRCRENDNKQ